MMSAVPEAARTILQADVAEDSCQENTCVTVLWAWRALVLRSFSGSLFFWLPLFWLG